LENIMDFGNKKNKGKKKDQQKKMTLAAFGPWIKDKCGAEYVIRDERVDCVASIDHIEPGCFAALYVMDSPDGLEVFELTNNYSNKTDAWEAIQYNEDTYPPEIFEEWVGQQYITDKNATVERLEF